MHMTLIIASLTKKCMTDWVKLKFFETFLFLYNIISLKIQNLIIHDRRKKILLIDFCN